MSDLIERAKNHLAHLESWNEYRTVDFGEGPESRGGEHTDTITIMSELVAALQPVEEKCRTESMSSRVCERGTKCCVVYHGRAALKQEGE